MNRSFSERTAPAPDQPLTEGLSPDGGDWNALSSLILSELRKRYLHPDVADDLTQQTLLELIRLGRPPGMLRGLAVRIARFRLADHYRKAMNEFLHDPFGDYFEHQAASPAMSDLAIDLTTAMDQSQTSCVPCFTLTELNSDPGKRHRIISGSASTRCVCSTSERSVLSQLRLVLKCPKKNDQCAPESPSPSILPGECGDVLAADANGYRRRAEPATSTATLNPPNGESLHAATHFQTGVVV